MAFPLLESIPLDHPGLKVMTEKLGSTDFVVVPRNEKYPPLQSFHNVADYCKLAGGIPIFGWAIWWRPETLIEAIPHCVVGAKDGGLIDVTAAPLNARQDTIFVLATGVACDAPDLQYPVVRMREFVRLIKDPALCAIESAYIEWTELTIELVKQLQGSGCSWTLEGGWTGERKLEAWHLSAAVQAAYVRMERLKREF